MLMMSASGQTIRIGMNELRVMGRNTQGVKLANLRNEDTLVAIQKMPSEDQEEGGEAPPALLPEEGSTEPLEENSTEE
jgi:DNA gyrase subunit A